MPYDEATRKLMAEVNVEDPVARHRREADERQAELDRERRRRAVREARRKQAMQEDYNAQWTAWIEERIATEVDRRFVLMMDQVENVVGTAIGQHSAHSLQPIREQINELRTLLQQLRDLQRGGFPSVPLREGYRRTN